MECTSEAAFSLGNGFTALMKSSLALAFCSGVPLGRHLSCGGEGITPIRSGSCHSVFSNAAPRAKEVYLLLLLICSGGFTPPSRFLLAACRGEFTSLSFSSPFVGAGLLRPPSLCASAPPVIPRAARICFSLCHSSLRCRVVVVADHPRNLPCAVFVLPQMDELPFANPFGVFMARMVKAVHSHLHRAIALHVINLQRPRDEFPRHSAADILFDAIGQCRSAERHATLIVIELHVLDKE